MAQGSSQATYDDANLLLKLYELRREDKMREARAWFVSNFKPKSVDEMLQLCPPGSAENAKMRQVITYWDMAASFVASGVLNPEVALGVAVKRAHVGTADQFHLRSSSVFQTLQGQPCLFHLLC